MTASSGQSFLSVLRAAFAGVAGVLVVMALAIAALAAAGVGVLVALAALAVGLAGRRPAPTRDPGALDARQTPSGWVVEAK
jgi:hypothetical protein